jgi:TrmH family RNA methyltransferase
MRQILSSFSNEKVKYVSSLKEKKNRDKSNQFYLEGYREIKKAIQSQKIKFNSLYISYDCFLGTNEESLISELENKKVQIFEIPRKIFEKISYRDRPDGLIAICEIPDYELKGNKLSGDFFAIIEGVEKPGNLGTILRTAEGAGLDGIFISDSRLDLFNPNVIRSSTGTLFTLPIYVISIEDIFKILKQNNIRTLAVTPESKNVYHRENLKEPIAFIFGSEQYGLTNFSKDHSNDSISIPMKGEADSLNLAMSAGIIFYETLRQRNI